MEFNFLLIESGFFIFIRHTISVIGNEKGRHLHNDTTPDTRTLYVCDINLFCNCVIR